MTDDIPALKRELQQIEARHREGSLSADAYAAEKARVERALVDRVLESPQPAAPTARPSKGLVASLAAVVVLVAGIGIPVFDGHPLAGCGPIAGQASRSLIADLRKREDPHAEIAHVELHHA